jgi:starch synthase
LKLLFLASEVAPFSKTGGLGDVAGALPVALAARGHTVRVVSPRYGVVSTAGMGPPGGALSLRFPYGERTATFRTLKTRGVEWVFVEQQDFFGSRQNIYGSPDDARRFSFFSLIALAHAKATGFSPDAVHLNDWQTGLAALALHEGPAPRPRTVTTIHNIAYQGNFDPPTVPDLGVSWNLFHPQGVEFYGQFSFMKTALVYSDAITTVSPTYAEELQTPEGANGMDGLLRHRKAALSGILNGIDVEEWNPDKDTHLAAPFTRDDISGKEICTRALIDELKLKVPTPGPRGPIFGSVGRMADQKGVELWQEVVVKQLKRGGFAVVLGSGEKRFEDAWRKLAAQFPGRLAVQVGFDEGLAHRIEAGSDFFVMPSKFEPCGLNQMYSLRYGTVPIVRSVGGLVDTVVDLSEPESTGIRFEAFAPQALERACDRAWALWHDAPGIFAVRRRGMAQDFSWNRAAAQYEGVYGMAQNA